MRKYAIGCGVALLVAVLLGVFAYMALPRALHHASGYIKEKMKEQEAKVAYEAAWKGPTPEPSEQWFPAEIGEWKRQTADPLPEYPEMKVTKPGYKALYRRGEMYVEVRVFPATPLERDGLITGLHALKPALGSNGTITTWTSGNSHSVKYGDRERFFGRFLGDSVMFVLHTTDGVDLSDFNDAHLRTLDEHTAPAKPPVQ